MAVMIKYLVVKNRENNSPGNVTNKLSQIKLLSQIVLPKIKQNEELYLVLDSYEALNEVFLDSSKENIAYPDLRTLFNSMLKPENMDFEIVHKKNLADRYILLRWKLERKKLPAPILLTTFFSKEWNYDTGWKVIKKL